RARRVGRPVNCFFFSSRRRHTRWPRDWSSDVCSSDLEREMDAARDPINKFGKFLMREGLLTQSELQKLRDEVDAEINDAADRARSEERRVGKECRSRWWTYS